MRAALGGQRQALQVISLVAPRFQRPFGQQPGERFGESFGESF
jgi:hypothetical protein